MKSILAVTIIASFVCSVYSLQCYYCDSTYDAKCGENFEKEDHFQVDCERLRQQQPQLTAQLTAQYGPFYVVNATGCMKRHFQHASGQPRIHRTCFFGDLKEINKGCNSDQPQGGLRQGPQACDVCGEDLCNSSSSLAPIGFALLLLFALARLL